MDKNDTLVESQDEEHQDLNRNGIDDEIEPPVPDIEAGTRQIMDRYLINPGADPTLSGGDLDARWEDAESTGDETVGGSAATPERNDLDARGRAMGITYGHDEELRLGEKERARDEHRWELDPASSEDYVERLKDKS